MKTKNQKVWILISLLLIVIPFTVFSADIVVPNFSLITRGYMDSGIFSFSSYGDFDFSINGGYKFDGSVAFTLENRNLEDTPDSSNPLTLDSLYATIQRTLLFKYASARIRNIFTLPLHFNYFIGEIDTFANGDDFIEYFFSNPFATEFRGYMYFAAETLYDGLYTVNGNGVSLETSEELDWGNFSLYAYQDFVLGPGNYSIDLRSMINSENLKLELFLGTSFPAGMVGAYRAGLMFYLASEAGGELFTQIGIPRWEPGIEGLTINHFYFLLEPRIRLDFISIYLTFFWHPQYYNQLATGESGAIDISGRLVFGDTPASELRGGVGATASIRSGTSSDAFSLYISPFLQVVNSGVLWDFKLRPKIIPFALENLFEGYIGIRTSF